MRFFKILFAPKEARPALGVLEEAEYAFCREDPFSRSAAFELVKPYVEEAILARHSAFRRFIQKGTSPRQYVYSIIANTAGDLVESGRYHLRPGHLNPVGPGEDLRQLFCWAVDELVRIGAMGSDYAKSQKDLLEKGIATVG